MAANDRDDAKVHAVDVIRSFDECVLVTLTSDGALEGRPMAVADVDDDGSVTFITGTDTAKAREIERDQRVLVTFQGARKYATLRGTARLDKDRERLASLWQPAFSAWFDAGPDDPTAVLVEVAPEQMEIWDGSGLKGVVSLFQRAKAAVTKDEPDIPEGTHEVVDVR